MTVNFILGKSQTSTILIIRQKYIFFENMEQTKCQKAFAENLDVILWTNAQTHMTNNANLKLGEGANFRSCSRYKGYYRQSLHVFAALKHASKIYKYYSFLDTPTEC